MLEVIKAGSNKYGVWVYGSLSFPTINDVGESFGSFILTDIFITNLAEVPNKGDRFNLDKVECFKSKKDHSSRFKLSIYDLIED